MREINHDRELKQRFNYWNLVDCYKVEIGEKYYDIFGNELCKVYDVIYVYGKEDVEDRINEILCEKLNYTDGINITWNDGFRCHFCDIKNTESPYAHWRRKYPLKGDFVDCGYKEGKQYETDAYIHIDIEQISRGQFKTAYSKNMLSKFF